MRKNFVHLTNTEMLSLAKERIRSRDYWGIIGELHRRGGREIFRQAVTWSRSPISQERQFGACILGQLGWSKDHFRKQSIKILMNLLDDSDTSVISSAAYALGHRNASEAIPKLVNLSNHRRAEVRQGVVSGLLTLTQDEAINALIKLSTDRSKEVRNWATFGLGSMIETDSEVIRNALIQRLTDSFIDVRMEALNGLASRKHPNAVEWTLAALKETDIITGYLGAAENLADIRLLPELERIKAQCDAKTDRFNSYFLDCLEDAIAACSENQH
jgi:vesicle coat complex subunit